MISVDKVYLLVQPVYTAKHQPINEQKQQEGEKPTEREGWYNSLLTMYDIDQTRLWRLPHTSNNSHFLNSFQNYHINMSQHGTYAYRTDSWYFL